MVSTLYEKTQYTNKHVNFLKASIREYDMKSAGFNILKNANVLSEGEISYLEQLDKKERNIKIGIMQRDNKKIKKIITQGFVEYRKKFFEANDIKDSDVLAIKKDAIFLINRPIHNTEFGYVKFELKNKYSSYYYLDKKELYFKNGMVSRIDVKGIHKNKLHRHVKFMRELIKIFKLVETSDSDKVIDAIRKFAKKYLAMELPIECYREFNSESNFRFKNVNFNQCNYTFNPTINTINDMVDEIDILYNYNHIIVPLIKIFFA